jgi:proteinaceous RNase P
VTNDQLKDHVWAMLRPKHILKWRERHIARYSIPAPPGDT